MRSHHRSFVSDAGLGEDPWATSSVRAAGGSVTGGGATAHATLRGISAPTVIGVRSVHARSARRQCELRDMKDPTNRTHKATRQRRMGIRRLSLPFDSGCRIPFLVRLSRLRHAAWGTTSANQGLCGGAAHDAPRGTHCKPIGLRFASRAGGGSCSSRCAGKAKASWCVHPRLGHRLDRRPSAETQERCRESDSTKKR